MEGNYEEIRRISVRVILSVADISHGNRWNLGTGAESCILFPLGEAEHLHCVECPV
jgi:hypothetical protein